MDINISMKKMLESGVHFGHRTNKWNPLMRPYIFTERNGIHIIDLQQTVKYLEEAYNIVHDMVAEGGTVLFVGTKRQAQETILEEATRCGMPYVTERWLPGTLTNWITIYQRILELERLEKMHESSEIDLLIKKEVLMIERKIKRLLVHLSGIRHMTRLPEMLFVVDVMRDNTAVHEANLKNIPVVAIVDTNCNPNNIDHIIPANDDAIRAIKLLVSKIADAVLEGKAKRKEEEELEEAAKLEGAESAEELRGKIEIEEELEDKDLLGEATLAKLSISRLKIEDKEKADSEKVIKEGQKETEETKAEAKHPDEGKDQSKETAQDEREVKPKAKPPKEKKELAKKSPKEEDGEKPEKPTESKPKAKPRKTKKEQAAKVDKKKQEKEQEEESKPKIKPQIKKKELAKKSTKEEHEEKSKKSTVSKPKAKPRKTKKEQVAEVGKEKQEESKPKTKPHRKKKEQVKKTSEEEREEEKKEPKQEG
jgi:small subunit ribosomal protein S2